MLSGNPFLYGGCLGQSNHPINRRSFLALGLAVPLGTPPVFLQSDSRRFFPISMDRCAVVSERPNSSPMWHCQVRLGTQGDLIRDWWLLISPSEGCQHQLTVIQPPSVLPQNPGLVGLLAARITFRLHALQRRGTFRGEFNKHQIVQQVNRQILKAMKNLPC